VFSLASLSGLILACAPWAETRAAGAPLLSLGAWVTYWDLERGMERLSRHPGAVTDVFFFVAELGPDGRPALALEDARQTAALRGLQAGGARAWMTVVNDTRSAKGRPPRLKDADAIHRMLADPEKRSAHRRGIVDLAAGYGFAGVDVDYENLLPSSGSWPPTSPRVGSSSPSPCSPSARRAAPRAPAPPTGRSSARPPTACR
jgi:hypothetical protein